MKFDPYTYLDILGRGLRGGIMRHDGAAVALEFARAGA